MSQLLRFTAILMALALMAGAAMVSPTTVLWAVIGGAVVGAAWQLARRP